MHLKAKSCVSLVFLFTIWLHGIDVKAQCLTVPVPMVDLIESAGIIVEAEVMEKYCTPPDNRGMIYTVYVLSTGTTWKSPIKETGAIQVWIEGGFYGDQMVEVTPSLKLDLGYKGIFFLQKISAGNYTLANGVHSYYDYIPEEGKFENFVNPPMRFEELMQVLEASCTSYPKSSLIWEKSSADNLETSVRMMPVVTSFSPQIVTAGTQTELTITGTGFGSSQGSGLVLFRNADTGGGNFIVPQAWDYISWSDTEIRIFVPSSAGTGTFVVRQGSDAFSPTALQVEYAVTNLLSNSQNIVPRLQNDNGSGGVSFRKNTNFAANTAASLAFNRAAENWICNMQVNWRLGPSTTVSATANDNVNVVAFVSLPSGTLGINYNYYQGCSVSGNIRFFQTDTDVVFNSTTNWYYGTGSVPGGQSSFETTALHELGHSLQLGHVIAPGDVMHFASTVGTSNLILSQVNLDAANFVWGPSTASGGCGFGAASNSSCVALPVTLLEFFGQAKELGNQLIWKTTDEIDFSHFEVQIRDVAQDRWVMIEKIPGAGNRNTTDIFEYQFMHPTQNNLTIYRLLMVDLNGTSTASESIAIRRDDSKKTQTLTISPNPVRDQLFLQQIPPSETGHPLALYDGQGRQIWSRSIPPKVESWTLECHDLAEGYYIIKIGQEARSFVKIP